MIMLKQFNYRNFLKIKKKKKNFINQMKIKYKNIIGIFVWHVAASMCICIYVIICRISFIIRL